MLFFSEPGYGPISRFSCAPLSMFSTKGLGWEESDLCRVFFMGRSAFEQAGYSNVYCDLLDLV